MAAAGLLRALQAPKHYEEEDYATFTEDDIKPGAVAKPKLAPPYGKRSGFVPRKQDHFGGGGAFPECHVAQHPLGMGKEDNKLGSADTSQTIVPTTVDEKGNVSYDAIVKHGQGAGKNVLSKHNELLPKLHQITEDDLKRPDEEELLETQRRTEAALGKIVDFKLQAAQPKTLAPQPGQASYIKYTPVQKGDAHNSGAQHRVIRMSEMPTDPLEPPRFRHKKVPRGPGSPPVPVLHSPPRNLSVKDQQDWKIPPCISNWKNQKGYTIPLDKRLAADGRDLQETQINDNFAKLSEALYVAEQKAREAVEMRSKIQKELMMKEKEKKEDELRALAQRARMERAGGARDTAPVHAPSDGGGGAVNYPPPPPREQARETAEEREERKQREAIRSERRSERERERRREEQGHGGKKSKISRDHDRDISEKIALGQANVAAKGEAMYDQRLFNQDQGISSGFGAEDSYSVYDKGLFAERSGGLYKPKASAGSDDEGGGDDDRSLRTDRFKPDKGFAGASAKESKGHRGANPVQFEKDKQEADPFGLDAFLTDLKKDKKERR